MPSITESLSMVLLAGAATGVFAAPSHQRRVNLVPLDIDINNATALGEVITSALNGTNTEFTLLGNDICIVDLNGVFQVTITPEDAKMMQEAQSYPPGCQPEQVDKCAATASSSPAPPGGGNQMCSAFYSCDPSERGTVWYQCKMQQCQQNGCPAPCPPGGNCTPPSPPAPPCPGCPPPCPPSGCRPPAPPAPPCPGPSCRPACPPAGCRPPSPPAPPCPGPGCMPPSPPPCPANGCPPPAPPPCAPGCTDCACASNAGGGESGNSTDLTATIESIVSNIGSVLHLG